MAVIPTQYNQGAPNPPISEDMEILQTTGYTSNQGKKCPLCAFNAMGRQIILKSIQDLLGILTNYVIKDQIVRI